MASNNEKYISSEKIEQLIIDLKIYHPDRYRALKDSVENQLAHMKAIESGEYEKSPYAKIKINSYISTIRNVLNKSQSVISFKNKEIIRRKRTEEFLLLQLEHEKAMITKDYNLSPYYQDYNENLQIL